MTVQLASTRDEASNSRDRAALDAALAQVNTVLLGKTDATRAAFACLLAGGHLLIEDLPGVGKTTLAHALAAALGLEFHRAQFTSDMLPADLIGVSIFDRNNSRFEFRPGPVFTQLLLADEINRASPKTQSALLECMAEDQVTVDGISHPLPQPFFVVATQNPVDLAGTFPLPDSQLDRFLMRLSLGYPDPAAERQMLLAESRRSLLARQDACMDAATVSRLRQACAAVKCSDSLIDYLQRLLQASREHAGIAVGLSPRAGIALLAAARAWAFIERRDYVIPEDIQAVFVSVAAHRLVPGGGSEARAEQLAAALLEQVAAISR